VSTISGRSLIAVVGAPACLSRLLILATPLCQRRMCSRRSVRRTTASLALWSSDRDRPKSNDVQSCGSESACVLASALFGLGAVPLGAWLGASLLPSATSPPTVGFLRVNAGEEEPGGLAPGGGRGATTGASQILDVPLDALPAGAGRPSRRSASSCSSESGAGGPGAIVELSSCAVGTRAPFGCRPTSAPRSRDSDMRHLPIS